MAADTTIEVKVPELGESITEATIVRWIRNSGDIVMIDESICELETDKATVELPAPAPGALAVIVEAGETVDVGRSIATIDTDAAKASAAPKTSSSPGTEPSSSARPSASSDWVATPPQPVSSSVVDPVAASTSASVPPVSPAARRLIEEHDIDPKAVEASGKGGLVTKPDVVAHINTDSRNNPPEPPPAPELKSVTPAPRSGATAEANKISGESRIPMSRLRKTIASRLVGVQQTAAILTTFNEIDMTRVIELRRTYKEAFQESHGVSLGYMSFFARATVLAAADVPMVNARIDGDDIVQNEHVHLGIAASTQRGLVVPVVRNAESRSLAGLEREIGRLAELARNNALSLGDLSGGTFTISNGGVFGSLMSTPILNPPQSGILGMHKIEKRPIVIDDEIVIRPMMYVALSYDHRLVDGKEAVTFLVRIKENIENPERMMLEV